MERAVGWFVLLAVAAMVFGFGYYVYNTAERKGWFLTKARYFAFTDRADGLKRGAPVMLMGLDVGRITKVEPMDPSSPYNMYLEFEIQDPYYGYIWTEGSRAKVVSVDLLGGRVLEVTKGTAGYPVYIFNPLREISLAEARGMPDLSKWALGQDIFDSRGSQVIGKPMDLVTNLPAIAAAGYTNLVILNPAEHRKSMTGVWNDKDSSYEAYTPQSKPYWLSSDESASVTERLDRLVSQVETALPQILGLTNQLDRALGNTVNLTSNLNMVALSAQPTLSNLAAATAGLDRPGGLGDWLLPVNVSRELAATFTNASGTFAAVNTNLPALLASLGQSLDHLASLTSNLNSQVLANTNILSEISRSVTDTDDLVQGLKRHWLLRSAFKTKPTNAPPAKPTPEKPKPAKGR